jgi:hypothetical protein
MGRWRGTDLFKLRERFRELLIAQDAVEFCLDSKPRERANEGTSSKVNEKYCATFNCCISTNFGYSPGNSIPSSKSMPSRLLDIKSEAALVSEQHLAFRFV